MSSRASLNHIYRSVWNQALGVMVAVAEIASVGSGAASSANAQTLPTGGVAVHGSASFSNPANNKLVVTTQNGAGSSHSAINWNTFSIGAGATTQFVQPSAASMSINRVVTNMPSQLFGTLSSNGQIVLVNQSGIAVGAGAVVDTAGFTASAVGMTQADAIAGRLRFAGDGLNNATGALTVQGNIIARGGDVVLIAPSIDLAKTAVVESQGGSVSLAAGQSIEITGRGLEGITLQVQAPTDQAINLGTLKGDAVGIFAGTLRHSGMIQAVTADLQGGKVVLKAAGDAYVEGQGQIVATGTASGARGGSVDVFGKRVAVADNALIDVSGDGGGGNIRVGGDFQGKNPNVPNAQVTYLGPDAKLKADSLHKGNGGRVIVWADDTTRAYGNISVRGGASGGDGGFVETSGKRYLSATRAPDIAAPKGKSGLWLLDPNDINIVHAAGPADVSILIGGSNPINMSPSQADNSASTLTDFTINSALASGDVQVLTASGNGGTGDINFDPSVGGAVVVNNPSIAARGLILTADGGVRFKAGTTTFQSPSSTSSLNVQLNGNSGATTDVGAVVTLNGAGGNGQALATLDTTRTWTNNGTLNITGNAAVHLNNASGASTFTNASGGVLNVGSTTGFAFYSSGTDSSVVNNQGLMNVTQGTAFEALYSQGASGILTVKDVNLNLQNLQTVSGTVNLMPAGATGPATLNVNEVHGPAGIFSGVNFPSPGFLNVDGSVGGVPSATFIGVSAGQTQLTVGGSSSGNIDVGAGNTIFASLNIGPGGAFSSINGGNLGVKSGNFNIPQIGAYSGSVGFFAVGNVTLPVSTPILSTGNLKIMASWDGTSVMGVGALQQPTGTGTVSLLSGVGVAGTLSLLAKGDITQTASAINASNLIASTDGNIVLNLGNSITTAVDLLSTTGGINFNNSITSFNLTSAIADQSVNITTTGSLATVGPVQSSTGDVTITAPGGMTLGGNVVAAVNMTLDSSAGNGIINQTAGNMNVPGATTVSAGAGDIALFSSANNFNNISLTGGHVSVVDANALNVTSLSFGPNKNLYLQAGGTLTVPAGPLNTTAQLSLISGGAFTTPGNLSGSTMILAATNGLTIANSVTASGSLSLTGGATAGINQTAGVIVAAGATTTTAGGSQINLSQPGNDFSSISAVGGTVSIADTNALVLANVAAGSLGVTTNGAISQVGGTSLAIGGNATFASGTGNMSLTNAPNTFGSVTVTNGGNVSITESAPNVTLNAINAGSFTFLATGGNILFGQDITTTSGVIDIKGFGAVSATAPVNINSNSQILFKATGNLDLIGTAFHSAGGGDVILGAGALFNGTSASTNFTSGGRWLTYLTNPAAGHTFGSFSPTTVADFRQLNALFQAPPLAAGNGSLWTDSGIRSSTLLGNVTKTYDGSTSIDLAGAIAASSAVVSAPSLLFGETLPALTGVVGTLTDPNVGTGKTVNMAAIPLTGVNTANGKPTLGYTLSASGNIGTVNAAGVSAISLNGLREYDGTTVVNAGIFSLSGLIGSETLTLTGAGSIADKNVGVDKPVTLGSLTLGNGTGLASNYTFIGGTRTATITSRTLSTWIGGASGLWSNASNWDVLPDGANVRTVAIPAGTTALINGSAGPLQLERIFSAGTVALSSGADLSISDKLRTAGYLQNAGQLSGAGGLEVNGNFVQTGGSIALGGPVAITQNSGNLDVTTVVPTNFARLEALAGNIRVTNTGGIFTSGRVRAPNGTIRMIANSPLVVGSDGIYASGDIDLAATNLTSAGNMLINGDLISTDGSISLFAGNNFRQNGILLAALGITVNANGSLSYGPLALSHGNPVSYRLNGVSTLAPPSTFAELIARNSAGNNLIIDFLNKFEDAIEARAAKTDDPKDARNRGDLVVEGETCRP